MDHIEALRTEGELFLNALRRLYPHDRRDHDGADSPGPESRDGLDTVVPSCPEWTVRELGQHTGRVHRWAAS